jgi:hypothetical protein
VAVAVADTHVETSQWPDIGVAEGLGKGADDRAGIGIVVVGNGVVGGEVVDTRVVGTRVGTRVVGYVVADGVVGCVILGAPVAEHTFLPSVVVARSFDALMLTLAPLRHR